MSHATLMWRTPHWIGGMGILVFILAILPMAGDYNMHIMRAESPGPSVGKLVPKIRITAKLLYSIYFCMTIVMMILLLLGKMPLFDSICMSRCRHRRLARHGGAGGLHGVPAGCHHYFYAALWRELQCVLPAAYTQAQGCGVGVRAEGYLAAVPLPSCSSPSISGACSRPCLWHSTRRRSRFPPLSPQRDTPPLITTAGRSFPKQSCCSSCLSAPVPVVRAEA